MKPITAWAITKFDQTIGEKRVVDIYLNAEDANRDAIFMQPDWVEVEPWLIHTEAQYGHSGPAVEEDAGDFDTPIHVTGEVR